jgi:hypothetical protein
MDPLRSLLDELLNADATRQRTPRDSPEYPVVEERVDELVRAVWDAAMDDGPPRAQDQGLDQGVLDR